ncbi:hypothetical protein KVT40_002612 [Elsinoe batatas]|uniref:Uncharacterized protein n=1 Tax=Elsinoe batatas TaxID=2601811 RepID=A0A8K0L417_9PEZI|nr:hypothetical protein KVT40_002612 [Elsinoe batatas]
MITPSTSPTLAPSSPTETTYVGARFSLAVPRIPNFVRRAVPQLGAFQRVQKLAGLQTQVSSTPSHTRSWSSDMAGSGTVTPPPSYSETLAPLLTPMKFARRPARESEGPTTQQPVATASSTPPQETIQWKYATQGLNLLSLAAQETTTTSTSSQPDQSSTPFARQLYIHALTYLLRALPTNLSPEETTSLSASLPSSLLPDPLLLSSQPHLSTSYFPAQPQGPFPSDPDFSFDQDPEPEQEYTQTSSILYRLTSLLITRLALIIAFLLPWIQYLLSLLLRLNREHNISSRMFSSSLATADAMGRGAWGVTSGILALQDGKIGKVVEGVLQWWIRGVTGGVWEGVGEGLEILGLREEGERSRRGGGGWGDAGCGEYYARGQRRRPRGQRGGNGNGTGRACYAYASEGSVRRKAPRGAGGRCAR